MGGGEFDHGFYGKDDVFNGAAARKVGNWKFETLEDGAGDSETGELLEGLIENVASVEIGGNEDISLASDGRMGGFFLANAGIDGGVELEFAIDENGRTLEGVDDEPSVSDRVVFATATESGERKQGEARRIGEDGLGGVISLIDNF